MTHLARKLQVHFAYEKTFGKFDFKHGMAEGKLCPSVNKLRELSAILCANRIFGN